MHRNGTSRRRDLLEAVLLFLLALLLNSGAVALRTQERLSEKVVRLHILADTDAPADQAVKLRVRDRILREAAPLLEDVESREEAEAALRAHLPEFEDAAEEAVTACGYNCPVTAELRETEFPTRCYDGFALPAGRYLALRVVIGQGAGRNWWCVVFPPLCAGGVAASGADSVDPDTDPDSDPDNDADRDTDRDADRDADTLSGEFTAEEVSLITRKDEGYVLKFRVVELWETLRQTLF